MIKYIVGHQIVCWYYITHVVYILNLFWTRLKEEMIPFFEKRRKKYVVDVFEYEIA